MLICSSPQLFAACHVLLRLLMPRHSPYALLRLNFPNLVLSIFFLELLEFLLNISFGLLILVKRSFLVREIVSFCLNLFPPFGEIVIYPNFSWKDLLEFD